MSNTFTTVATVGAGAYLAGSIRAVLVGVLLFFVSFPILWLNEGRVDLSMVAKESTPVDPSRINPAYNGKLVAVTSEVQLNEQIGDPSFLKEGPYLSLHRVVEVYAWAEKIEKTTVRKTGQASTEETKYTYEREWTTSPPDSSKFKYPEDHKNPEQRTHSQTFTTSQANIGAYMFRPTGAEIPWGKKLALKKEMLLEEDGISLQGDTYLFHGIGTFDSPMVGDERIYFEAMTPQGVYTLLGQQQSSEITNFYHSKKDVSLFRLLQGDRNQAIVKLATEHKTISWMLRILGFLMMWIGLSLMISPINMVLDFVPLLGSAGRLLTALVLFPAAMVLSAMTILISIIAHNVLILLVVLGLFFVAAGFRYKEVAKRKQSVSST